MFHISHSTKKSFSLVEIIIVIVIISILSIFLLPRFEKNSLDIAANRIINDIEITRMLALHSDTFDTSDSNYFKKRWQLIFSKSNYSDGYYAYTIFLDDVGGSSGNPDIEEIAKNPTDETKLLSGGFSGILKTSDIRATPQMNVGKEYGVVDVKFEGGCKYYTSKRIGFDELGRPLVGNISKYTRAYQRLMKSECEITLCEDSNCDKNRVIIIEPYTGYVRIK